MLAPIFEAIEKFIVEFSLRRLLSWVVIIGGAIIVVYLFESKTAYFELQKLQAAQSLLEKMKPIKSDSDNVEKIEMNIIGSLERITSERTFFESTLGIEIPTFFLKAATSALPWLLMMLAFLPGLKRGEKDEIYAFVGLLIIAVFAGIGGAFIPDIGDRIVNYWVIPWVGLVFIIVAILIHQSRKKNRKSNNRLHEDTPPVGSADE